MTPSKESMEKAEKIASQFQSSVLPLHELDVKILTAHIAQALDTLEKETIERCAKIAEQYNQWASAQCEDNDGGVVEHIARRIRSQG